MLEKSRVTPQRGDLSVSRSFYCLDSLDPVGDVPFHCMLLLGLWGQTKGNELCISPQLDQGPAELAGPALDSVWLCKGTALTCQGSLFGFSQEHCLPSVWALHGGYSQQGCFPLSDWGMGTVSLVLRGEKNWTKTFKTTGGQKIVSPVVSFTGPKTKRCSPVVLTTGSGMLCCYPCFTFKEVEMDLIKIVQSRNCRTGSGQRLCFPVHWTLTFNVSNEGPAPRGWYIVSFSLKPLMPFQLLPWSGLFVKDLLSSWQSFLLPLCKNSMLSLVSEGIVVLTA